MGDGTDVTQASSRVDFLQLLGFVAIVTTAVLQHEARFLFLSYIVTVTRRKFQLPLYLGRV